MHSVLEISPRMISTHLKMGLKRGAFKFWGLKTLLRSKTRQCKVAEGHGTAKVKAVRVFWRSAFFGRTSSALVCSKANSTVGTASWLAKKFTSPGSCSELTVGPGQFPPRMQLSSCLWWRVEEGVGVGGGGEKHSWMRGKKNTQGERLQGKKDTNYWEGADFMVQFSPREKEKQVELFQVQIFHSHVGSSSLSRCATTAAWPLKHCCCCCCRLDMFDVKHQTWREASWRVCPAEAAAQSARSIFSDVFFIEASLHLKVQDFKLTMSIKIPFFIISGCLQLRNLGHSSDLFLRGGSWLVLNDFVHDKMTQTETFHDGSAGFKARQGTSCLTSLFPNHMVLEVFWACKKNDICKIYLHFYQ